MKKFIVTLNENRCIVDTGGKSAVYIFENISDYEEEIFDLLDEKKMPIQQLETIVNSWGGKMKTIPLSLLISEYYKNNVIWGVINNKLVFILYVTAYSEERNSMLTTLFLEDILNERLDRVGSKENTANKYKLEKNKNNIVYKTTAVGLSEDDINMTIKDKHLLINSKKSNEIFSSNINHSIYVGDEIISEGIDANLSKGILTIKMPLSESKRDYKINF